MDNETEKLASSMKSTAASRFNASKRLKRLDVRLTALAAFTAALVILLSVAPFIWEISERGNQLIAALTVGLSLTMLAASLLQFASAFGVDAELHHRSALQIQALRRAMVASAKAENWSLDSYLEFSKRYSDVLELYALNHDDIDFARYRLENAEEFPTGRLSRSWMAVNIWMGSYYPTVVLFVVVGGAVLLTGFAFTLT